jgi:Tfp pilus assembly ATPase PilU
MDQSLLDLVRAGHITGDSALERAFDRETFRSSLATLAKETGQHPDTQRASS